MANDPVLANPEWDFHQWDQTGLLIAYVSLDLLVFRPQPRATFTREVRQITRAHPKTVDTIIRGLCRTGILYRNQTAVGMTVLGRWWLDKHEGRLETASPFDG